jgi:hypothetical protein
MPPVVVALPRTMALVLLIATPLAPTLEVAPPVELPSDVTTKVPASTVVVPV